MTRGFNWLILVSVVIFFIFSLALIFDLAPHLFLPQLIFVLGGLAVFFIFARLDYQIFKGFFAPLFFLAMALLILPFVFGSWTRATRRWIKIGSLAFQPSELTKPLLILVFASLASFRDWQLKDLMLALIFLLLPAFLIFQQPDLGSSLVVFFVWLAIVWFKIKKKQAFFLLAIFGLSLFMGWVFLRDYQKDRLYAFLNPLEDPLGKGYHLIQAEIAAGSGKFLGKGLLKGTQSHLKFLPERHSDFIFASLSEELGFLGSTILLLVYFLLLAQILKIAKNAPDEFGTLVCLGVFALFLVQVFINIGMNLGLLPITGITLPLVSSGGSSIMALMISLGLVESVAQRSKTPEPIEIR
jgi:rod shape determining protein RodA